MKYQGDSRNFNGSIRAEYSEDKITACHAKIVRKDKDGFGIELITGG